MGFFGRSVITNPVRFSVNSDACPPLVLKPDHAKKSRLVAPIGPTNVLCVPAQVNNAQVAQPVVSFAPVNMVNQAVRPRTVRVKPSKTMRFVNFLFYAYRNVSKLVGRPRNVSHMNGFGGSRNPRKNPRVGVVVQQLAKVFYQNIVSHVCNPFWRFNVNAGIIA
jgi:hypothetical protein